MNFNKTKINDLIVIEPSLFEDERGYFFETFNHSVFEKEISNVKFIQDNESRSKKGVLRGLHFQKPPFDQSKLVRCSFGEILDVAVDLRSNSSSFGKYISIILSENNKKQLFIPKGFAHGFLVLSNEAIVTYKVDNKYSPNHDSGIHWNDPELNISWNFNKNNLIISEKDNSLPYLNNTNKLF